MKTILLFHLLCLPFAGSAQECTVDVFDAHTLVGEEATVCGPVSQVFHSVKTKGKPHYINMGDRYPNHAFTVVIWGSDKEKFDFDLKELENKRIAVTGTVAEYNGKPQIIVYDPGQIEVLE